jgi:drug/metabolite transporter (DMT)-like permease
MIALSLGLMAALFWAVHDLVARSFASSIGPYRMAVAMLLTGAVVLAGPVLWQGVPLGLDGIGLAAAVATGVVYALAVGGLFKAFSLAPVSIVAPLTAGYPALVIVWGLISGLSPGAMQWLGCGLILTGAIIVGRSAHGEDEQVSVEHSKMPVVIAACLVAVLGFAGAVIFGQIAGPRIGEFETTFISRFPAAIIILPLAMREPKRHISRTGWYAILAMAIMDVLAVSAVNLAGSYPGKEFGSMGISAYGALGVLLAMIVLKERVTLVQWGGIALVVGGIALLGMPN